LLVAYDTEDGFDARSVLLADAAAESLRNLGNNWTNTVVDHEAVAYEATAELSDGQVFLVEDPATLADFAPLYELVEEAAELPALAATQIDRKISLYAVVAGDAERVGLFKRSDPRMGYTGGRRFLAVLEERLERIEAPTF